jgi:hypothetical protein
MDEDSAYLGTFDADDNVPQGVSIFSFSDASTFTENDDNTAFASETSSISASRQQREQSFDEIRGTSALANVGGVLKRDMTHRRRHTTNYLEGYTSSTSTDQTESGNLQLARPLHSSYSTTTDQTELQSLRPAHPLLSSSIDGRRRRYRRYDDTSV